MTLLLNDAPSVPIKKTQELMVVLGFRTQHPLVTKWECKEVGLPPTSSKWSKATGHKLLQRMLAHYGDWSIYYHVAVPGAYALKKPPNKAVWTEHIVSLRRAIQERKPDKLLICGSVPLSMLMGASRNLPITKYHGMGMMVENQYAVVTYSPHMVISDENLYRDFEEALNKLMTNTTVMPQPDIKITVIENILELELALRRLFNQKWISCDLETWAWTPQEKERSIMTIGFGALYSSYQAEAFIIRDTLLYSDKAPQVKQHLRTFFQDYKSVIAFHNGKFDLRFLQFYLGDFDLKFADTMLMHYALDERPVGRYKSHGLKDLSRKRYDAPDYAEIDWNWWWNADPSEHDWPKLYTYQSQDLYYTARLLRDLTREIRDEDAREGTKVIRACKYVLHPASIAYARAENRGIKMDMEHLEGQIAEISKKLAKIDYFDPKKLEVPVTRITRGEIGRLNELVRELDEPEADTTVNALSPTQVQRFLYEKLQIEERTKYSAAESPWKKNEQADSIRDGGGTRKYDLQVLANDLEKIKPENESDASRLERLNRAELLRLIVSIREAYKILQTYFVGLRKHVNPATHRIHTDIRLAGTSTGRLSSSNPNLQNIPARGDYAKLVRNCFVAEKGFTLVQCDYSQLELRVAAYLSRDEKLAYPFRHGIDIHRQVAADLFRKKLLEISKLERHLAKSVDFGIVYGRTPEALVDGFEMDLYVQWGGKRLTVSEARAFIEQFLHEYSTLKEWIERVQQEALKKGYCESFFGRKRRFPLILDNQGFINGIKRQAVNTPIQSMASDICLKALIELDKQLNEHWPGRANILFSVHDSILFEIDNNCLDEAVVLIREVMEHNPQVHVDDFVPFEVTLEAGDKWGLLEAQEWPDRIK